jgi:phosphatidylinositol-4,5-bisphosphate 3-kinase
MREKAKKSIKDLKSIVDFSNANWLCASREAVNYKRRKIPTYLLHKDSSKYPTYLCQSTLSLAFANVNSIKLNVNLKQYT